MKLYLVRHGEAVSSDLNPSRPLSSVGQAQVHALGSYLNEKHVKVNHIYHSGILRANQTANLLAEYVSAGAVEQKACLMPEDSVSAMLYEIEQWSEDTLLVGHLPYMMTLLLALVGDPKNMDGFEFTPSAVVCLERVNHRWIVLWVFQPS